MVGSINPFELFLIYVELARAEDRNPEAGREIAYMIDQSHNVEAKIEAMIQSVMALQEAYARALLVNWQELEAAQRSGEVLGAHRALVDAYSTDVRPLCATVREEIGASADPIAAFRKSGYHERMAKQRQGGVQAGWA